MNGFLPCQKILALSVAILLLSLHVGSVGSELALTAFEKAIFQVYLSVDNDRDAENIPLKTGPEFPANADMILTAEHFRQDGPPSPSLMPAAAVPFPKSITFDIFIPPRNLS